MTYYAITLKQNYLTKPQEQDYEKWFEYAYYKGGLIKEHVYELDSKDRLHVHAIMVFPRPIYKKQFMLAGMHQKIDQLKNQKDFKTFANYMSKSLGNRDQYEQMLQSYYYRNFYGFCDAVSGE